MRLIIVSVVGLLFVESGLAADKKIDIRWRGHSYFQIETSKGTRLAIDPHAIDAYNPSLVNADVVLISHEHDDHNQADLVRIRDKKNILRGVQRSKDNPRKMEWAALEKTIDDVSVRTVGTYHDASNGLERGLNSVFIIEVDGMKIVHLGDLGHVLTKQQIARIGAVDILMIPVGGVYTINGEEAKRVVDQLKPRYFIIPMHHATTVYADLLPPTEFLDEFPKDRIKKAPGNRISIETDRKPPAEPTILMLNWK